MLWPLAWLICVSRVVLGMHYPSDVIAGGVIGWMVASAALAFFP
jgi:undecaprenyl-diphosphatase